MYVHSLYNIFLAMLHGEFFCHLDYTYIRGPEFSRSLFSVLGLFFSMMSYRSKLFEKRCGKAEYLLEERTICNLLDQSFWDKSSFSQTMMFFNWCM